MESMRKYDTRWTEEVGTDYTTLPSLVAFAFIIKNNEKPLKDFKQRSNMIRSDLWKAHRERMDHRVEKNSEGLSKTLLK